MSPPPEARRDTRRYRFSSVVEVIDLGLRLEDIAGLEREPAAATKISETKLREQLAENGASPEEIEILLRERVELNAMASDALIAMIERKLKEYGLKNHINNQPKIVHTTAKSTVRLGTKLTIKWPSKSDLLQYGRSPWRGGS
jgi:hypothetical protein